MPTEQTPPLPRYGVRVRRTTWVLDRGPRPAVRGWGHFIAAIVSVVAATALSTVAWMTLSWGEALGVSVYGLGLVGLFGVSAAYHRWPWKSAREVMWWRRADHATIAIFIAATYTPMCLIVLSPKHAALMLAISWSGAALSAGLNFAWINHPRWLDVVVYLALGWIVVPLVPTLWHEAGAEVLWLLFAGGIIYSVGALVYGFRWPGREARYYGYHEHFHTATIVAAAVHFAAVWIVVSGS